MDDHNSISDSASDGDGDSDSSVNSISISNSNSSDSSEEERSNRNTSSSSKRRNQPTKATQSNTKKKNTQHSPTTRRNRSSNNNNNNSNNNKKNNNVNKNLIHSNNDTARRSKLAREHRITAAQEQEIHQVFHLFAEEFSSATSTTSSTAATAAKKGKTTSSSSKKKINNLALVAKIHVTNLRRALIALSLTPTVDELREYISILDPEGEGVVEYEPFVGICALKINSRTVNSEDYQREVDEAWGLFVREGNDRITLASLREVARSIGEDGVSDELLRDMVLEANGGAGLARGVDKGEFEDVMRKAGVWR